ncbi:MAG: aldo/keto reductase [Bryobacteraceae bacterium]
MKYRELGKTGLRVSVLGFGASPLGNVFDDVPASQAERAVHAAIDRGINFFDVSPYYGATLAEHRLGAALEGRRKEVVLSTKCGRYGADAFDFSAARVAAGAAESLRRLRTDYVDLLLAHDIEFADRNQILEETIPALRRIQASGMARFIGITGLPLHMLADVAERGGVDVVLSYCRYNLLTRDMDRILVPMATERHIGLINASPLHMRILTPEGAPSWHPAPAEVREAGARVVALLTAHGVQPAVFALRFCLDNPSIASTLVGMSSAAQVDANLQATDYRLDPELLVEVDLTVSSVRDWTWNSGRPENND